MRCLVGKVWGGLAGAVTVAVILSACGTTPVISVEPKNDQAADMSGKLQSLQKQLREREKRIEELESQLDMLKLIDQDFTKQRSLIRPPATLTPVK